MTVSALRAAEHILHLREAISTTSLELNKLVFLAHGWSWGMLGEPLVSDEAEAWEFGPVYRSVHNKYGKHRGASIPDPGMDHSEEIGSKKTMLLQAVAKVYQKYSPDDLVALTHAPGSPWEQAWKLEPVSRIPDSTVRRYYEDLVRSHEASA